MRATKDQHQVATVLDPEDFQVVDQMSKPVKDGGLGVSRAEAVRRLVTQGIALRAAGDSDQHEAIVRARAGAVDAEITKHLLDVMNDHLERVGERSWQEASLLASGSATALKGWAEQQAVLHGTTLDSLRLARHQELSKRLVVRDDLKAR